MDAGAGFPAIGFIVIYSHSREFSLAHRGGSGEHLADCRICDSSAWMRVCPTLGSRAEVFGAQASHPLLNPSRPTPYILAQAPTAAPAGVLDVFMMDKSYLR